MIDPQLLVELLPREIDQRREEGHDVTPFQRRWAALGLPAVAPHRPVPEEARPAVARSAPALEALYDDLDRLDDGPLGAQEPSDLAGIRALRPAGPRRLPLALSPRPARPHPGGLAGARRGVPAGEAGGGLGPRVYPRGPGARRGLPPAGATSPTPSPPASTPARRTSRRRCGASPSVRGGGTGASSTTWCATTTWTTPSWRCTSWSSTGPTSAPPRWGGPGS